MSGALKRSFRIKNRTSFFGEIGRAKSTSPIIDSLLELPEGWHYGEGGGATRASAETAKIIDACFLKTDVRIIEVFPCLNGGILVCGRHKNEDVEVLCHQDGRLIDLCHEIDDEPVHEENNITIQQASRYLEELSWERKLSGWFTQNTSAGIGGDLKAGPSKILVMAAEPHYFAQSVPEREAKRNVVMLSSFTTRKPLARRRFYGASTQMKYQMEELSSQIKQKIIRAT